MAEQKQIYHIYDKVMKKIVTLSSKAVIDLINGLFGTTYPLDSPLNYNWTENISDQLKRTIADTIITINGKYAYHLEAQINEGEELQFRIFDYGYQHALKVRKGMEVLLFPEPIIIYLYKSGNIPDVQTIVLDFGNQGTFNYRVDTFKFLEHSLEELKEKHMVILLPFLLLKLRVEIEKRRTVKNMEALKDIILHDIIGTIDESVEVGRLTLADAGRLRNLVRELYHHIYAHYDELQKEGINEMVEDGLILEMDIIEDNQRKELEKQKKRVTEEVTEQMIKNVYSEFQDASQVARVLKLPLEQVQSVLEIQ